LGRSESARYACRDAHILPGGIRAQAETFLDEPLLKVLHDFAGQIQETA